MVAGLPVWPTGLVEQVEPLLGPELLAALGPLVERQLVGLGKLVEPDKLLELDKPLELGRERESVQEVRSPVYSCYCNLKYFYLESILQSNSYNMIFYDGC